MLTPPSVVESGSEVAETVLAPTCLPKAAAMEPGAMMSVPLAALMMARERGGCAVATPPARDEINNVTARLLCIYRYAIAGCGAGK